MKNISFGDNNVKFAIDTKNRLIVCPYFDYRQLSNRKIARLADLLLSLNIPLTKKPSLYCKDSILFTALLLYNARPYYFEYLLLFFGLFTCLVKG